MIPSNSPLASPPASCVQHLAPLFAPAVVGHRPPQIRVILHQQHHLMTHTLPPCPARYALDLIGLKQGLFKNR